MDYLYFYFHIHFSQFCSSNISDKILVRSVTYYKLLMFFLKICILKMVLLIIFSYAHTNSIIYLQIVSLNMSCSLVVATSSMILDSLLALALAMPYLMCRYRHIQMEKMSTYEKILALPRWFSYKETWEATCVFKEKLGNGSFETVFKEALIMAGGEIIAMTVKRSENMVEEGEWQFQMEMRSIGRIHLDLCNNYGEPQ